MNTASDAADVTVVAPVYNEAGILGELARRIVAAVPGAQVLLVDDGSNDTTREISATLPAEVLHLPANVGQLRATQAGLRRAVTPIVAVIDGDLQDPPELLPQLVQRLRDDPSLDVVFAAKTSRDDAWWFRAGRAVYALLLAVPGARAVPAGCGAYCAMRLVVAHRVGALALVDANLAPVLVALGCRHATVPYAKAARYDGQSRVGPLGLIAEALPSLALTGALSSWLLWVAAGATVAACCWPAALGVAAAALAAAWWLRRWAHRVLGFNTSPSAPPDPGGPP